jgi:exonuclease SbcC
MLARRDAALRALADDTAAAAYLTRIERSAESRREMLLEVEILLGLECPPDLQAQRLALQVKHLRERFQSATTVGPNSAGECLLAWCAQPGVIDVRDRQRCERVFSAMEQAR